MPSDVSDSSDLRAGTGVELRPVAWWLVACAAMIFVMVVLGGATRLTQSGLSMTQWQPLTLLPPLTLEQWQQEFANYQLSPQFIQHNAWMSVEDFKEIFWLEYLHRLWGRLIGFVFFVPFVWFAVRRVIDRTLAWKLGGLFVLGGLQGALGWFMVASGLADRPSVSHYRLAPHLLSAFILYGLIVWVTLDLFGAEKDEDAVANTDRKLARGAAGLIAGVLVLVGAGALVAGLHAGLIYNTFPLMDGQLIPEGLGELTPWWLNLFENVMTVQFQHRVLAILLLAGVAAVWWRSRKSENAPVLAWANALLTMTLVQAALGITTLVLVVPLLVALAHQAGALILFTLAICFAHAVQVPRVAAQSTLRTPVANPAE